ncbi:hypothetical protein IC762_11680 [Bradyrhizobium genosp. L]|uniref:DUF3592 domain-containing protein n=1 Tax=Bradyrhizobium genosp. L TaxID=83637 RepID=UPI0018A3211D|nr:DUF3592 domain-containing protein [Bradyrhizobium genosp. L]QPF86905.1 hypothetical protein IC762_11680 [Bradyrhizobium genosp. L]
MGQAGNSFSESVTAAVHHALSPLRVVAEAFGYSPADMQIWAFICGLLLLALVFPQSYGDLVLRRRRAVASGKVVGIDTGGDGPDTPIIEFADRSGKIRRFESHLPVNAATDWVGARVSVIYDPLHPTRAREDGRAFMKVLHAAAWYAMVLGLFAFAFWPGAMAALR